MQGQLVSILLPVYNSSRYVRQAMDSLLQQTHSSFEIIAVDDGSADASLEILHEYERRDRRVNVCSLAHMGIVGALNEAIKRAQGEFLARMDADDVAVPTRLERQLSFLNEHRDCVVV